MLYYPEFEVNNINWLKFALLYLDDIQPIIPMLPYDKSEDLTPLTLDIMNSTDLIREYHPNYGEGNIASLKAMDYGKCLTQYFPPTYTPRQIQEIIIKLLESWHRRKHQTRSKLNA